ncbi:HMG-Y-related protein A [Cucurbita argyrosperma subsp. argyrosperma]|uniref:HMG-Y-related protein A n=2 Tax=Cucurbita TaxID=3660 RepID=A0A6J1FDA7_CUCMO
MGTEDQLNNPPQPPPPAPSLPHYPEMIMTAIEALNDKNGVSKTAITKQIESTYGDLPPAFTTLLAHHLDVMKQTGKLLFVKNNYMKPDPNAPPKRGRGRPPKPKVPLPPGTVVPPPRPRGRPPKPKDPFAPISQPKKKTSTGSGRPRGRPPKSPKPAPTSAPPVAGPPRGRGRPPKVKPAVAPIGC